MASPDVALYTQLFKLSYYFFLSGVAVQIHFLLVKMTCWERAFHGKLSVVFDESNREMCTFTP